MLGSCTPIRHVLYCNKEMGGLVEVEATKKGNAMLEDDGGEGRGALCLWGSTWPLQWPVEFVRHLILLCISPPERYPPRYSV